MSSLGPDSQWQQQRQTTHKQNQHYLLLEFLISLMTDDIRHTTGSQTATESDGMPLISSFLINLTN